MVNAVRPQTGHDPSVPVGIGSPSVAWFFVGHPDESVVSVAVTTGEAVDNVPSLTLTRAGNRIARRPSYLRHKKPFFIWQAGER